MEHGGSEAARARARQLAHKVAAHARTEGGWSDYNWNQRYRLCHGRKEFAHRALVVKSFFLYPPPYPPSSNR